LDNQLFCTGKIKLIFVLHVICPYMTNRFAIIIICLGFVFFSSCATPVSPGGGEPDRQGPAIIATKPEPGAVNFDDDEVEFEFDQFVNRQSFTEALTIEPNLNLDFDINWGRKSVEVEFVSELPENTTIILTVGTDLTDTRSNKMSKPFTLALSTGPVIDRGGVRAKIRSSIDGKSVAGQKVFLIREPGTVESPASYVAETDTSGTVEFSYLGEGTYRPFWVDDINNNRTWEPSREAAQPFYVENFELKRGDVADLGTLYTVRTDTLGPILEGVGLLTSNRLRLRFNEEIFWDDDSGIAVSDTLGNLKTRAYPLYVPPGDPLVLIAQSEDPLSEEEFFTADPGSLFDEAGNRAEAQIDPFPGSSVSDTVSIRYLGSKSEAGLFPDDPVELVYNKFIDDQAVIDSLIVIEGDQPIRNWPQLELVRHKLIISPQQVWQGGVAYEFRAWDPFNFTHENLRPKIWHRNQLGSIEINVQNADTNSVYYAVISNESEELRFEESFRGSVEIDDLPPLEYVVKVFEDKNENNRWDSGMLIPYLEPEKLYLQTKVPVKEAFVAEVTVEFREAIERIEERPESPAVPDSLKQN